MKRMLIMLVAAAAAVSVNAKTLALWTMELDPDSGTFDGRNAVAPEYELSLVTAGTTGVVQDIGWNLPPNPEEEVMFPVVSRTAVKSERTAPLNHAIPVHLREEWHGGYRRACLLADESEERFV